MIIYEVVVDISAAQIDKAFYYKSSFSYNIGDRVLVPFGNRNIEGFIIGISEDNLKVDYEIKEIYKKLDNFTCIAPEFIELAAYMKTFNLRYIDILRLFMPPNVRKGLGKEKKITYFAFNENHNLNSALAFVGKAAKVQQRIVEKMFEEKEALASSLNKEFSPASIKSLLDKGVLYSITRSYLRTPEAIKKERMDYDLTPDQKHAVDSILNTENKKFLMHGVTGSGKTHVYISVIEHYLKLGKTAILLVPEISLTPQMVGIFRSHFGDKVGLLHSKLSSGERYDEWQRIREKEASVVIGPRSAIFAPLEDLGVIIMDEEHDQSYVSESNPRYFTLDVAEFRARYNDAKLILGSATPSVETYKKAEEDGEYVLLEMPNRINKKEMPEIEIIDMKVERKRGNKTMFSKTLISAINTALEKKEQVILFLNRRGYASYVNCQDCGYIAKCPFCDVSLTYHKSSFSLMCHYCGARYKTVKKCPICTSINLKDGRVGTEQVSDQIHEIFPLASVLRLDNDTTTTKNAYNKILSDFNNHKADILIGTQMVAKGHDFPNVTIVGILDADISLYIPDYKSNERTFQLITQVSGRAGREKKQGKVYLQTFNPSHPVYLVAAKYDYKQFYYREKQIRKSALFPPYTKIIKILFSGLVEFDVVEKSRVVYANLQKKLSGRKGVLRIKHMQPRLRKLKNKYQYQIMLFIDSELGDAHMQEIYDVVNTHNTTSVSIFVEINPQQDV